MKVIEFIKQSDGLFHGLQRLEEELGIKAKVYHDRNIFVLNYNQIESPKTDPIVRECRGLILNFDLEVVARPFDRFYNLGEALNVMPVIDWAKAKVYEKVDGSLIKMYWDGQWEVATRGTAFAESECMGHGVTFRELVFKALGVNDNHEFQKLCSYSKLNPCVTYVFELTCFENRVVRAYNGYNLHFLGARHFRGHYLSEKEREWLFKEANIAADMIGNRIVDAKQFSFNSEEEAVGSAAVLKDLDEGYVVYQDGVPICKIKSPAYVAVHHIRGEGLNPKRMSELVISGEVDEYLTYFPQDREPLEPYIEAYDTLMVAMDNHYEGVKGIEDQKEFAQAIKGCVYSGVLFGARSKGISVIESFNQAKQCHKVSLLEKFL